MSQMDVTNFQSCEFFNEKFSDAMRMHMYQAISDESGRECERHRSNERSLFNTRNSRHTQEYFFLRKRHSEEGDKIIPKLGGDKALRMERLNELNRHWDVAFGRDELDRGEEVRRVGGGARRVGGGSRRVGGGCDEWEEGLRKPRSEFQARNS